MDWKDRIKSILPSRANLISDAHRILDNANYRNELLKLYQQIEETNDLELEAAEIDFKRSLIVILNSCKMKYSEKLDLYIREGLRKHIQKSKESQIIHN